MSTEEIRSILEKYKIVAVMGLSTGPAKDSHILAKYLKANVYRIVPINPFAEMRARARSLLDAPEIIEIVDISRPAKDVPPIVDQAIKLKKKLGNPRVIWMQLGIINEKAARQARNAGSTVVMDRCTMTEHKCISVKGTLSNRTGIS